MITDIKRDLAENFRQGDEAILKKIIDEVTHSALSISNRKETDDNIDILAIEIKSCVKALYLQRGGEGNKSISESGINSTFIDPYEKLRVDIVKAGKRLPRI